MVKNALGLIEVVGLAAAMEAADAAVKAANVELLGYENAKGGGYITIKVVGDVGAVKAAIDAASAAAAKINKVVAKHVIPRPHSEIGGLVLTNDTVGSKPVKAEAESIPEEVVKTEQTVAAEPAVAEPITPDEEALAESEELPAQPVEEILTPMPQERGPIEVCNLCSDPACPRKKGDPRVTCIHYTINNKEDE